MNNYDVVGYNLDATVEVKVEELKMLIALARGYAVYRGQWLSVNAPVRNIEKKIYHETDYEIFHPPLLTMRDGILEPAPEALP